MPADVTHANRRSRENRCVATSDADRKRLWARSGNRCVICRQELVRAENDGVAGALVGQEAHIIGRSPGGPRYEPLAPAARDGYDNLILLCANDHTEIDAQPSRYPVEHLRRLKRRHELWVKSSLAAPGPGDAQPIRATVMRSGAAIWDLMNAFGYECGYPDDLTDEEADLVDEALQVFVDWGEIAPDVVGQGFRAVREAKRAVQSELDLLTQAGFVVLGAERTGRWAGEVVTGKVAIFHIIRASELYGYRIQF